MKKVAVLLLAAGLVFGAAHKGAQAADIKVSGEWDFNTEWTNIGCLLYTSPSPRDRG